MEVQRGDLEKLVGWKKTYTYRQIASLRDMIRSRNQGIFANLMGKRSAFDDSDEEEQYPEERPQGTHQPEMGQAPPSQMTRARAKSSRKRNPLGQTSGHQKRKRGDPEVVEVDPLSFSLPAIHELSSIDKLLKEGYADQGWGAELFEGVPRSHALLTFDPPRVECADLPDAGVPRLEDGMRQAVQAVNSFVTVCADLEGQLVSARKKATSEENRAGEAETQLQALEEERGRLEEELEGMELTHNLQMESLLTTSVPKSRLDAYILAGVQRYLGSSEFALGINDVMDPAMERGARKVVIEIKAAQRKNEDMQPILDKYADREMKGKTSAVRLRCKARKHFRDMDFAHLPIMQQIAGTCPSISKPEDILNIPGSPSFVFQMPRGTQTPLSTPPGPDEEPERVASAPPPQVHNCGSRRGGGTSTDSNTNSGDKVNDA
ncbi:OLC1v1001168C1 [Oldenlandia corymbosa var. corymbosa]|uniref:OLC1v1001168C1 n=1 Tax=Oldenlandia corymbosa var. corymbosa TaxID=529605 RepID=A0AAV1D7G9_OLDCO|nr:OLC1v1001168C1 [Oldenlandia corymbosa var. corymbosa]